MPVFLAGSKEKEREMKRATDIKREKSIGGKVRKRKRETQGQV